jgi:hypothetical protein
MTQSPNSTKLTDPFADWRVLCELAWGHNWTGEFEAAEEYAAAAGEEYLAAKARAEALEAAGEADQPQIDQLNSATKRPYRQRKPRHPTPDGLKTAAQAAAKLGCSIRTLNGHIASGALRYVIIGHGTKRPRKMFTDPDLDNFITNQTRKDVSCPPTSPKTAARLTSTTTSKCEVIGFTARRNARRAAKPKK